MTALSLNILGIAEKKDGIMMEEHQVINMIAHIPEEINNGIEQES